VARTSSTSKQQQQHASEQDTARGDAAERVPGWRITSELRWRPHTGQPIIFLSDWVRAADADAQPSAQEEQPGADDERGEQEGDEEAQMEAAARVENVLPPVEMLRLVTRRWANLLETDEKRRALLVSFRAPGVLAPGELTNWLPGAAARLYTLGGLVAPLSDTALSRMPLARYSVVRAPNMSFWPHLRALLEEQERVEPGMELWEDLESDLALLEQELAWWIASPQGLILNLYEEETLVGHLSLARQYDPAEGCDGWGIIALHIAPQARGQRLGTILQRVAATLLVTRKTVRRIEPPAEPAAAGESSPTMQMAAVNTRDWPFLFGFVAAHNIPALRGAYAAGRRIIGTYVDVPIEALEQHEA
jgi:GNAT superfamily N-acetyltransferase